MVGEVRCTKLRVPRGGLAIVGWSVWKREEGKEEGRCVWCSEVDGSVYRVGGFGRGRGRGRRRLGRGSAAFPRVFGYGLSEIGRAHV